MIPNAEILKSLIQILLASAILQYSFVGANPKFRCVIPGVLAITFDDGPHTLTPRILDVLKEKNTTATFFINGQNYLNIYDPRAQAALRRTISEGHGMGSHTWSHPDLRDLNSEEINYQMNHLTEELIRLKIWASQPQFMRPPYGAVNDEVVKILTELKYTIVNWSIDTMDWAHPGNTTAGMQNYVRVLNGTDPATTLGFIALHHDVQVGGAELAMAAIDYVRSLGYRFVSLKECLGN